VGVTVVALPLIALSAIVIAPVPPSTMMPPRLRPVALGRAHHGFVPQTMECSSVSAPKRTLIPPPSAIPAFGTEWLFRTVVSTSVRLPWLSIPAPRARAHGH
jgi:hypothetical protein